LSFGHFYSVFAGFGRAKRNNLRLSRLFLRTMEKPTIIHFFGFLCTIAIFGGSAIALWFPFLWKVPVTGFIFLLFLTILKYPAIKK